jgi:hypothetical protein
MSESQGRIMVEQAYAQGKMLDHSGWSLARGITPSDIDFVIEASRQCLFAEFSRDCGSINCLKKGQAMMYRRIASKSTHDLVVVCNHSVEPDKVIDSRTDVKSCTIYFDAGARTLSGKTDLWQWLVESFTGNPERTIADLREIHERLFKEPT